MTTDAKLSRAVKGWQAASQAALAALKEAMPAGRHVRWLHGQQWRGGEVVEVLGHSYGTARVRIRTIGQRTVDIYPYRLLEHL